ncbi:MAG: HAMP domain-containing sensor histidine kinase, partial [Gemmatimonadaceae bacterium]
FAVGDVVADKEIPLSSMFIIFTGHLAIRVDSGAGPRRVLEWFGGDVSGTLPYSRMGRPPGNSVAEEPIEALEVPSKYFSELTVACPTVTAGCVHAMLDRARAFKASDLQDEKMVSLGRLSAGLAHELNNPASAASRSAHVLERAFLDADEASMALGASNLNASQRSAIQDARNSCLATPASVSRTPLERADREEEIVQWLTDHGADCATADSLAETVVSKNALDELAAALDGPVLDAALRWIAAGCTVRSLVFEIERATSRIDQLVGVMKRWSYMDNLSSAEVVDVLGGLSDTVELLSNKAGEKGVTVTLDFSPRLPRVRAYGGELNQIWINVLQNAIDAAPQGGHVTISGSLELERVVVRIIDDGPGIPPEIMGRIFDPFFTTKPVGKGTGMGLEITQRLVRRNSGEVTVESSPGHTEFRLSFPVVPGG